MKKTATCRNGLTSRIAVAAMAIAGLVGADIALAQSDAIDEIVVTARKRSENLQDVPLAITAFSGDELERASVYTLTDLSEMTPGLTYQSVGAYKTPTMRGLAQTDQTALLGNVGVFIDGVFLNNRSAIEFGVLDLERIEVVKGPQGALYGRNTFAGAINYVTKAPNPEAFEAKATVEVGSDERLEFGGSINVPLGERAAARLFASTAEFDGTIDNQRGGTLGGYDKRTAWGITLLFEPTDRLNLKLTHLYNEVNDDLEPLARTDFRNNDCGVRYALPGGDQWSLFCGDLAAAAPVPNLDPLGFGQEGDSTVSYLDVSYDFDFATLETKFARTESEYFSFNDGVSDPTAQNRPFFPGSPFSAQFFTNAGGDEAEQDSVEMRLVSDPEQQFSWLVGGSWYDTQTGGIINSIARLVADPTQLARITRVAERLDTDIIAFFGSATYNINDRNRITAEVRHTDEEVTLVGTTIIDLIPGFPNSVIARSTNFDYTTPRVTYEFDWSDDIMLYASAANGVKSGGINRRTGDPRFLTFDPEENWTYELGARTTILGGRGTFNATIYYIDWTDVQNRAPASVISTPAIINADSAESRGIELDARIAATDNLELRGALTFLKPEFGSGVRDDSVAAFCGETATIPPAEVNCSAEVGGNQLPRTSEVQAYLGATYTMPTLVGDFDGYIRLDTSHQSEKFNTSLNLVSQGDINLTNIRLGLVNERYEIAIWADNLFDEEYIARGATFLEQGAAFACPACGITNASVYPANGRTFGLRLNANF